MTSLIAEMRAPAHPASRVVLIDLAEGWLGGCDLAAIGKVCDGAILCVYGVAPEKAARVMAAGRAALGPEKLLGAGFSLFSRHVADGEALARQVRACAGAGAAGFNFYNYGLIPAPRLEWIRGSVDRPDDQELADRP